MSIPTGSKQLLNIDTNNYTYLTGVNSSDTDWSTAKANFEGRGLPSSNMTSDPINLEDFELIQSKLPESQKDFIFTDNNIFTGDNVISDFDFTTNPTTEYEVFVTFIDEGAGYKNSLGYFFYVNDESGNEIMLDNADTNTDNSSGYYRPTIIFPNASSKAGGRLRSDGVLMPGDQRKLKGNLTNGKFKDVKVGFFLVPNGWDNQDVSTSIGVRYNNKPILHTCSKFNPNYVEGAIGAANYGYQSILFNYNLGEEYIVGFEDIQRPGGDGDFNDLIFRIRVTPQINLANTPTVVTKDVSTDCLQKSPQGLVFVAPLTAFTNLNDDNISYRFQRTIKFNSETWRDQYKDIYDNDYITFDVTVSHVNVGDDTVVVSYSFTNTDVSANIIGDNVQLSLLDVEDNRDDEIEVDPANPNENERTQFDKLVKMQRLENDNVLHENYDFFEINETTSNIESTIKSETNKIPRNITGSALIWGDPHIKTLDGKILTMDKDLGWFTYLETQKLKIEIELSFFLEHPMPIYREFSFIERCKITDKKTGKVCTINMFDISLPVEEQTSDYRIMEEADIFENRSLKNKLMALKSFDNQVSVKIVEWKNIHIWIIFYGSRVDFFNEVYLDGKELNKLLDNKSTGLILQ